MLKLLKACLLRSICNDRYIHYQMAGTDDKYDADNDVMRDITQTHEYHFFNPKFGLTYMPDKNNSVYASYSVSNREPNRNNYTERAATTKLSHVLKDYSI